MPGVALCGAGRCNGMNDAATTSDTLLVLWRDVTLRSDENRLRPWPWIMRDIFLCLLTATAERPRSQRNMPLLL